jgi:hypothetical protein
MDSLTKLFQVCSVYNIECQNECGYWNRMNQKGAFGAKFKALFQYFFSMSLSATKRLMLAERRT